MFQPGYLQHHVAASAWNFAFVTNAQDATDASSYSFATQSIGVAAADRYVIVSAGTTGTAAITITGLTVGGITATLIVGLGAGTTTFNSYSSIWRAAVPTGTTATVAFNTSVAALRGAIGIYRMVGGNPTATATASNGAIVSSTTLSNSLAIPTSGAGVGYVIGYSASGTARTATWTNLTENFDISADTVGGGSNEPSHTGALSTTAGTLTRTVTFNSNMQVTCPLVVAAWGP